MGHISSRCRARKELMYSSQQPVDQEPRPPPNFSPDLPAALCPLENSVDSRQIRKVKVRRELQIGAARYVSFRESRNAENARAAGNQPSPMYLAKGSGGTAECSGIEKL